MPKNGSYARAPVRKFLQTGPVFSPGSDITTEQALRQLHDSFDVQCRSAVSNCNAALKRLEDQKTQRDALLEESQRTGVEPQPVSSQRLARHLRDEENASKSARKALRATARWVNQLLLHQTSMATELVRTLHLEKQQILTEAANAPRINMHWTNLEGLITTPYQKQAAEAAFQTEEQSVGGQPISEERRSKLQPKPKPKARGKRVNMTVATAQPSAPAPLPEAGPQ